MDTESKTIFSTAAENSDLDNSMTEFYPHSLKKVFLVSNIT